jgi:hypothetical protein
VEQYTYPFSTEDDQLIDWFRENKSMYDTKDSGFFNKTKRTVWYQERAAEFGHGVTGK